MDKRWEVKLTHENPEHRDVNSFTWAPSLEGAEKRMGESMASEPEVWAGWTFTIQGSEEV